MLRWGGAITPPHLSYTPLSRQENTLFIYNGSGWRGVRGEVKISARCKTELRLSVITKNEMKTKVRISEGEEE